MMTTEEMDEESERILDSMRTNGNRMRIRLAGQCLAVISDRRCQNPGKYINEAAKRLRDAGVVLGPEFEAQLSDALGAW
jgi:hypothetical protein